MKQVTVIDARGATVRGPAKVKLTKDQHQRRAHVLGEPTRGMTFTLDGGQELAFKRGEKFGIDTPAKLSKLLFDWKGKDPSGAHLAEGDDTGPGGSGDDTQNGGTGNDTVKAGAE